MLSVLKRLVRRTVTGLSEGEQRLLRDLSLHRTDPVLAVAARLQLTPEAVVQVADGLERRGLLRLSRDQGQARSRLLAITKAGRKLTRETAPGERTGRPKRRLTLSSPLAVLRSYLPRFRV